MLPDVSTRVCFDPFSVGGNDGLSEVSLSMPEGGLHEGSQEAFVLETFGNIHPTAECLPLVLGFRCWESNNHAGPSLGRNFFFKILYI